MRSAVCLLAMLSTVSWAAPAPAGSAPTGQVHRSLIRFAIPLDSTLPAGSMVVCKAELVPAAGDQPYMPQRATGSTILYGAFGVCAVEMPLCWTGSLSPSTVTVRYEVDTVARPGVPAMVWKRGSQTADLSARSAAALALSLDAAP